MNVSVIVPAFNAAETLAETLDSLCAQTFQQWEAIVVDDGSTDDTASIATAYAQLDDRLHLVSQAHQGACAARNHGLSLANFDWLLFLDADDLLLPNHLERMTAALAHNPQLDAVHCDWQRVTLDGQILAGDPYKPRGQLFDTLARRPLFPPFACILRRSLVHEAGAWDTSFDCCQDWDLWQRCARTGARFGAIDEVLGYYRMRPHSLSTSKPHRLLHHGLRVIARGYSVDERVGNPAPAHAAGLKTPDRPNTQLIWLSWCAGLALGLNQDTNALLQLVQNAHDPDLDPNSVADCIFRAAHHSLGQPPDVWVDLWPQREHKIARFLGALEAQSQAPELAVRAKSILEQLVIQNTGAVRPLTIGHTCAIQIDAAQPPPKLVVNNSVKRLICEVTYAEQELGTIDLPVDRNTVSPAILSDAIAGAYAWPILRHFFEQTIYPELRLEQQADALSLWRGELCLAQDYPSAEELSWSDVHDDIGWTIFLQEVWGKPSWPGDSFYDPRQESASSSRVNSVFEKLHIEVSDELPDVVTHHESISITATVGGAKLGQTILPVTNRMLKAQEIRAAVTSMADFELCRLAVRQGLIGRAPGTPPSLRSRLQEAAAASLKTARQSADPAT